MTSEPSATTSPDQASATAPPLEARLVQAGKLSMGQLAQAHRERLETGKPLLEVVVDQGWVTAEDIAQLEGRTRVAAPEPPAAPEPVSVQPAAEPEAPEAPAAADPAPAALPAEMTRVLVGIRLTTGDLVPAGRAPDADTAATLGQAVVAELTQTADDEWPFFDGRFIKPDTIVSVDLVVEDD